MIKKFMIQNFSTKAGNINYIIAFAAFTKDIFIYTDFN